MGFGDKLINLRKQNKMTQEEMAEKLGITRQTVSNWELNQTKPDLEQLMGISRLYNISLDELANNTVAKSSNKVSTTSEKLKKSFYEYIAPVLKNQQLWLMIFTVLCVIALGTCIIVDFAINNAITWGKTPVLSIVFGYLIITPMFAKKHKIELSLCMLTITILPFLYFMEKSVPVKGWFYSIAWPTSVVSMVGAWLTYMICRFFKINWWYKSAILIFMWGAIISPIINHIADGLPYISFQNFINLFSSLVISAVLGICGYIRTKK